MKKFYSLAAAATAIIAFSGCSDDYSFNIEGEGNLVLTTTYNNDVKVLSRADLSEELSESTIVWISNDKGVVRKYKGLSTIPADGIKLLGGNYVAEAWAGDSVPASFESKYFKGFERFTITKGSTSVNMVCKIVNVVASVVYEDEVDEVLDNYTLTLGHTRASLTFEGRDARKGYFMMPSEADRLTWILNGTTKDGKNFTKTGDILDPQSATEYVLTVKYNTKYDELGGGFLTIEIDESEIEVEDEITITSAPLISGVGFNIQNNIYGEEGKIDKKSVYISAVSQLTGVVIESDALQSAISGNDVNLLEASAMVISQLNSAGIEFFYTYDEEMDNSNMKINFNEEFTNKLTGENSFKITATDAYGKSTTATLNIIVTDASVESTILPANSPSIWATKATLTGRILKQGVVNPGFEYRMRGAADWMSVEGVMGDNQVFTAELTSLQPGKTYEYRAVCDGFVSGVINTFTTETPAQPENAGFEDWFQNGKVLLIAPSANAIYWDSGNHGSSTMNKTVTSKSTDYVHEGQFSALLESQFVGVGSIGKFAAGNAFIGKYLGTEGTDGILGWGRPFTSRPTALKVYVKFIPATVQYDSSNPAVTLKKGDMDEGTIYIALLDDTMTDPETSTEFPVVIKTKSLQFFNRAGDNVIAFGEHIFKGATEGNDLVEITIPLDYRTLDKRPSYLLLTCAASRFGDYFAGGPSKMYVDDIQLVY